MRCSICDNEDDLIEFDPIREEFCPCSVCKEAIRDCLEDFEDDDEEDNVGH